ncbi:MAG: hypothetical protein GY865_05035 [candidate division Zixibacteria bacterium]|nr:hypothetical protein [candidate division Zixibacteria bacterium]
MKNRTINILIIGLVCLTAINVNSEDKFNLIKNRINSSAVVQLDVLITIESKVFNDIDSAFGKIILAKDGRYQAVINNDIYLNDGKYNWEYSAENNQATKRVIKEEEVVDNRLAFFKDIDSYYNTKVIQQDLEYKLFKLDKTDDALPDAMKIILSHKKDHISKIEYYDLNDDLNCIYITEQFIFDKIENNLFEINLPDSTEIILLP